MEPENEAKWVDEKMASLCASDGACDAGAGFDRLRLRRDGLRSAKKRGAMIAGGSAVLVAAILAAPVNTRAFAAKCLDACIGVVSPLRPENAAPDFNLADAQGKRLRLADLRGKVVVLNFWATWCAPCRVEMPLLADLHLRYREQGLTVVGVSMDDGWAPVLEFAKKQMVPFPVLLGNDEVAGRFGGVDTLPMTFLLDREGRVIGRHAGLLRGAEIDAEVQAALSRANQ